jgi:hypothetical protein
VGRILSTYWRENELGKWVGGRRLAMVGFLDDFRAVKVMDVQEVKLRTAKADTKEASGELFEVL